MKKSLHILTRQDDAAAVEVIAGQRARPDCEVEIVDLSEADPDYAELLDKVFAADSVAVW